MDSATSYEPLLWVFALLFLGTAGYLIANLGAVVALFGHRGPMHGDLQTDPHNRRKQAPRTVVIIAVALHVLSIAGLVFTVWFAAENVFETPSGEHGLPAEMNPL